MAGYYDPYEQYWQGMPPRGNVKQPTGLAMLLNSVLGNAIPGYQQGMQNQTIRQEQALREQQRQTNLLQQQKLQSDIEWEPASRFLETAKTFGGEGIEPTPQMRQLFAQRGMQIPEGALSTMGEKRIEAMLQMNENNISQKDRYRQDLVDRYEKANERLMELNNIKAFDAQTSREKNEIARQALTLKGEIAKTEAQIKMLKEQGIQLKAKAKDMITIDKSVAEIMERHKQGLPLRPGDEAAIGIAERVKGAGPRIAAQAREAEGTAERIRKAKEDFAKETQIVDSTLKELEGIAQPNTPMYQNIQQMKMRKKREVFEKYRALYPDVQFPEPGRSAISGSAEGVK